MTDSPRHPHWTTTYTARAFYPFDPRPEDIDELDIAHALSNVCRFGGHSRVHYSVAQHSVLCSYLTPREDALWALLHDAAEAYVGDMVRPVKTHPALAFFTETEDKIMAAICLKFGLPLEMPASVKRADEIMLATEKRDLCNPSPFSWNLREAPSETRIRPWKPTQARKLFAMRLDDLRGEDRGFTL